MPRSGVYYQPVIVDEMTQILMNMIDEEYTKHPFYGSPRLTAYLKREGYQVNIKRVKRLMRKMGIVAIYPKQNLSQTNKAHRVYPYLLRGVPIKTSLAQGQPTIVNTDQGSQFTSHSFTDVLTNNGIQISMDGKGRALDNIVVERLWRSVKYEDIYIKQYETVDHLYSGLSTYFNFYNRERPHQSLGYKTPFEIHFNQN